MPPRLGTLSRWEGVDLGRRRYQKKGWLRERHGAWHLTYRTDSTDAEGNLARDRVNVIVGPSQGPGRLTKRQAEKIAWEDHLDQANRSGAKPATLATLSEFIERRFLPDHVYKLTHAGQLHYKFALKHLSPITKLRIRDIGVADVQELMNGLLESGLSIQSVKHVKNAISAIYRHADRYGLVFGTNWGSLVTVPKMQRVKERHALTAEQAEKIIPELRSPAQELAIVSIGTSMNVAEMLGLRWKCVNFSDEYVHLDGAVIKPWHLLIREGFYKGKAVGTKNEHRHRQVPMPRTISATLALWRTKSKFQTPDDYVFASEKSNGRPWHPDTLCRRQLKPVGARHGCPWLSWHVFRRTAATQAEIKKLPLSDRKAMMGHNSTKMTMHYTIEDPERHREQMEEILQEILKPKGRVQ